jgi:large subunit ribosomal protein L13
MVIMKTFTATPSTIKHEWCVVDATDKTLGRLATELATRLRGKHKPEFTPNMDTGDHMIVINAEKIKVTGKKLDDKMYHRYTGYIGNLKSISLGKLLEQHPERVLQKAVKGMLPRNPLGRAVFRKLHVYAGPDHPHEAQQPTQLEL